MIKTWKIFMVAMCLFLIWGLSGCSSENKPEIKETGKGQETQSKTGGVTPLSPPVKVKVGTTGASVGGAGYLIAMDKGYFKEVGIDIELVKFDSAAKSIPMLASNQVDVASGAISAGLYNSKNEGLDIKILAGVDQLNEGHGWCLLGVRKDLLDSGEVKTIKDLKGRKIATSGKGATTNIVLDKGLASAGLTLQDVEVVNLGFSEMLAAFGNKAIDAAIINEPSATSGEQKGLIKKFVTGDKMYKDQQLSVLQGSPKFVANEEVSKRFMYAYLKGVRDYGDAFFRNKNKKEIVDILIKYLPIKDPAMYDKIILPGLDPKAPLNMKAMADDLEWLYTNEFVSKKPDINSMIDLKALEWAHAQLGMK